MIYIGNKNKYPLSPSQSFHIPNDIDYKANISLFGGYLGVRNVDKYHQGIL